MRKYDKTRTEALADITVEALTGVSRPDGQAAGEITPPARHWRWHSDDEGIAWLIFDQADASANTLSEQTLVEFNAALQAIEKSEPKGLVIRSAKKSGFIAGAEIGDFRTMTEEAGVVTKINAALSVLDRLAAFPAPTVAMIHGYCLGGGLELALACDHRVARSDARFGFPEVMLGLHPGLAGTWRSIRRIGPIAAMTMMLTGRNMRADRARASGLVAAVAEERHLAAAARAAIAGEIRPRGAGFADKLLRTAPLRTLTAWQMRRRTRARVRPEHYPAPFQLIDLWRANGGSDRALRAAETASFAKLMTSDTAQNLVHVFFLRERLKGHAKEGDHAIGHVHVIGAGAMGGDIAAWSALNGFKVSVQDRAPEQIAPAIKRAAKLFSKRLRVRGEAQAALDRLIPDPAGAGLAKADLVIEAVPENPEIKLAVYRTAEAAMREDAILATNTSSILLEQLRGGLERPERFIGLHFFNPVAKMPLVEVVTHNTLNAKVRKRVLSFVGALDKLPLPVKSAPGFLVNRALMAYLMEAMACLREGTRPETIDAAAEAFGMPMGPIELADQVGLDVCLHVAQVLKRDLDMDLPEIPDWFMHKIEVGEHGRKTGEGFYKWRGDKPNKRRVKTAPSPALQDRLMLPLINACVACVREGVVADLDAADAGLVFGAGFAPFRGGPMNYARARGPADVVGALEGLASLHGSQLAPDKGFKTLFKAGK